MLSPQNRISGATVKPIIGTDTTKLQPNLTINTSSQQAGED